MRGAHPIHVLHYAYAISEGGAANGIVNVCNGLDPERFRSSILSLTYLGGLDRRLDPARTAVKQIASGRGQTLRPILRLAGELRRQRPDVVHTHAWGTLVDGVVASRLARVPAVVHGEHGTMELRPSRRLVQRLLWGNADGVLAVSETLAARMTEAIGFPRRRITVVPNGVDTERFRPRPEVRARLREELGATDGDVVLGTVGRLHPIKGHAYLIRALAALPSHVRLWLVGDGELRAEHEALVAALGLGDRVRFLGHRLDAPEILAALDVMCQPSLNEGLSNTILEAMATGLPVVATAVGGNPELVEEGVTGRLVEPASPEGFSRPLAELAARPDERQRLGRGGHARVLARHSLTAMVAGYAGVYERVLAGGRRHG